MDHFEQICGGIHTDSTIRGPSTAQYGTLSQVSNQAGIYEVILTQHTRNLLKIFPIDVIN